MNAESKTTPNVTAIIFLIIGALLALQVEILALYEMVKHGQV